MISITATIFLALVISITEANSSYSQKTIPADSFSAYHGAKMPELKYYDFYEELRSSPNVAVIYPIFTQNAYEWDGFHDFYSGRCDTCTTLDIKKFYKKSYSSSANGFRILEFLGYETIDDIDVDKNPNILKKYDKIILLHNEFVTKKEFDAITNHPNVVYLYPHVLRSEVIADYTTNNLTLVRGPGFPENEILNGFDWKFDNSEFFKDWNCNDWEFYKIDNGYMLNCYPETTLPLYGKEILETMKKL